VACLAIRVGGVECSDFGTLEMPKSPILRTPSSVTKRLADLRSRWRILCRWRYCIPIHSCERERQRRVRVGVSGMVGETGTGFPSSNESAGEGSTGFGRSGVSVIWWVFEGG